MQQLTTFPKLHNSKAFCLGGGRVYVALSLAGSPWDISYNPNLGQGLKVLRSDMEEGDRDCSRPLASC